MGKRAQHTRRDFWVRKLRNVLTDHQYSSCAIKNYGIVAKRFLNYAEGRGISLDSVQPDLVESYLV